MELRNHQQEGRWQSGSSGLTNLSLNRQPEMHGKRWDMNGLLIRINTFSFHYIKCYDLLKFNHCCLAQERRQFCQEHSHDCGGIGVSPSCLDCRVENITIRTIAPFNLNPQLPATYLFSKNETRHPSVPSDLMV